MRLTFLLPLTVACTTAPGTGGTGATDTADTAADTADTSVDTADTGGNDTADTGGTGHCPTDETAMCGMLKGTVPGAFFAVRLYPSGASLPAADMMLDPTVLEITFPFAYTMKADAFHSDTPAGVYDAVLVIESNGDGKLDKDVDTTLTSAASPVTITEGVGLDGVDFVVP